MKKAFRYFLLLCLAALMLPACHRGPELISAEDMSKVYADLFLADQWVFDHHIRYQTDTLAVYHPIFEKYGYDVEDFRFSLDHYMNDADEFMDIIKETKYLLQCRLKDIDERRMTETRRDSLRRARKAREIQLSLYRTTGQERREVMRRYFPDFPMDSIGVEMPDTIYQNLRRVLKSDLDSLRQVTVDSLAALEGDNAKRTNFVEVGPSREAEHAKILGRIHKLQGIR